MNPIKLKEKLYKTYDIELIDNILYIHKPIAVGDFILLKIFLGENPKDIRVEPRSALRL